MCDKDSDADLAPVEPHAYVPSTMHMGDCMVCGHLQGSPLHSPIASTSPSGTIRMKQVQP